MIKKYFRKVILILILWNALPLINQLQIYAQVQGPQRQQIKWISVNSLHHWFSNGGAEAEYGRRGRAGFVNVDQLDGLNWPALYTINKGVNVSKSLWIGTTNFLEPPNSPLAGQVFPYKVVCAGPRIINLGNEIYADEFKLVGKYDFEHPTVFVDDERSSDREFDDEVDEIDLSQLPDRLLINKFHTSIGITVTRKILAFSQQYHNNYFIYEYVFKNTGIIDGNGTTLNPPRTLTDVIFHFQYRKGYAGESYPRNWSPTGASWGLNTINDAIGDPNHPGEFRAVWSYYGPHSTSPGISEDIGLPNHTDGSILAGTCFSGVVVLHADTSPQNQTDDPTQPFTTQFMPADRGAQGVDQYGEDLMTRKYTEFMSAGHPEQTQAEQIGKDANGWPTGFANTWGGDAGGYTSAQGFGPYNLTPGDSIRIVLAEAVAGIMNNRDFVIEIANKWFNHSGPFILPDGSETDDRDIYKNTWVFSGRDSLFQTFRRAIANFNNNYNIPQPPPPPDQFDVASGGNRISLTWSSNAESWPGFNGYRIYRAEGRPDTTFNLIFECYQNQGGIVNSFDDKTARRGFNYYYYIQSVDDGSTNPGDPALNIPSSQPLVSSKYYTMTNKPAFLTRPPSNNLSDIRVVPNPYNIRSRDLQFGQDTPDRLAFYGLPPQCNIKIYTETGDLIETIIHDDGSGDELWHSLTSSRQLVVSGLYIAYFEVPEDIHDFDTGALIFRKGENTIRKFIIIR